MYIKRNVCKILHNCNNDMDDLEAFSIDGDGDCRHDENNPINQSIGGDDVGARDESLQSQKEAHPQPQQQQSSPSPLKKQILHRYQKIKRNRRQQKHRTNELNALLELHLRMTYLERRTNVNVQSRNNKTLLK